MWCPKCEMEYQDGVAVCADCGGHLEDKPEPAVKEKRDKEQGRETPPPRDWALLSTTGSEVEADAIASLMKAYEIPVEKQYQSSGEYLKHYMGAGAVTVVERSLFVPEERLAEAKELLSTRMDQEEMETDPEVQAVEEDRKPKESMIPILTAALIGLGLFALVVLAALFLGR